MASSTASRRRPAAPAPAQEALDEPAARVLRQFRVVFNAVRTHFRAVEKQAGVAGAQLWALSVAGQRPGLGVSELARAMDIHQSCPLRTAGVRFAVGWGATPAGVRG